MSLEKIRFRNRFYKNGSEPGLTAWAGDFMAKGWALALAVAAAEAGGGCGGCGGGG